MYCTDETRPPKTTLYQAVYTANYFDFTSYHETQMHMDGGPNVVLNTLEKTGEEETQLTKVIYFMLWAFEKQSCIYTFIQG